MRVRPVVYIHNGFRFAWVSLVVKFKKRLYSNKYKEVISNNRTYKGASETKFCSHTG